MVLWCICRASSLSDFLRAFSLSPAYNGRMATRLKYVDRNSPLLLPPDLRQWIPEDDLVHFVIEAVEGMNLTSLHVNRRGTGSEQYPPRMMLALLIYCYSNGVFSSRKIERATYRDIAVRYLTADTHPDHDTICAFRRENFESVSEAFLNVLELAREIGVLKVGTISVDGTKIAANASKRKSIRYDRAGELIEQLELEIRQLMEQAEQTDCGEETDGQTLPAEIARRQQLKDKLAKARQSLEARVQRQAAKEQSEYQKKVSERQGRSGRSQGRHIKAPKTTPDDDQQINLTDQDSSLMRKNKRSEYQQAYNPQASVDADGSGLILGGHVSTCASDRNELERCVDDVPTTLGSVKNVLGDNGYANGDAVARLEAKGVIPFIAVSGGDRRREHDFRPKSMGSRSAKKAFSPWLQQMQERLASDMGRRLYGLRKMTVEPVFGIIKEVMGFRRFYLRGLEKVEGEWALVCLAYNMRRLFVLRAN